MDEATGRVPVTVSTGLDGRPSPPAEGPPKLPDGAEFFTEWQQAVLTGLAEADSKLPGSA